MTGDPKEENISNTINENVRNTISYIFYNNKFF